MRTLALTAVTESGAPRLMYQLRVDTTSSNCKSVLAAAALMPKLTHFQVSEHGAGFLEEWTRTEEMVEAFPLLSECVIKMGRCWADERTALIDIFPFLQAMSRRPLQTLRVHTDECATFSTAAMAALANCHRLRELDLHLGTRRRHRVTDWTDSTHFTLFSTRCLPCLRILKLCCIKVSSDSVIAIASAAPHLCTLHLNADRNHSKDCEASCHPAVVCAIVGGYCEYIEDIMMDDDEAPTWKHVRAADIVDVYQSAASAAGRSSSFTPFTSLRNLSLIVCWCMPASVWHALLSLLRRAARLHHVSSMATNDPLIAAALSYLPCLTTLSCNCLWPNSFTSLMAEQSERSSGRHHSLRTSMSSCPHASNFLWLTDSHAPGSISDSAEAGVTLNCADFFAAFRRSLSAEQQAVLARWQNANWCDGDAQLIAAETVLSVCDDARVCLHPHSYSVLRPAKIV